MLGQRPSGHHRYVCSCGAVISQCRCLNHNGETVFEYGCSDCQKKLVEDAKRAKEDNMTKKTVYIHLQDDTPIEDILKTVGFEICHYDETEAEPDIKELGEASRWKIEITAYKV